MTTVRLNNDILNKIDTLTKIEKTSKSEIIKKAIIEYYDIRSKDLTPFKLGADLFGRYGSSNSLSSNYKIKLKEKLHEKHSY